MGHHRSSLAAVVGGVAVLNVAGQLLQGPEDGTGAERRGSLLRKSARICALARQFIRKSGVSYP